MGRILWAEDSPADQDLIRQALAQMPDPPTVEFVQDGVELLAKLDESTPGLIVLDLSMPRMDGMETLERLKERGPKVGVIVFTAHDGRGEARQCMSRGAHDVIQKPTAYFEFVGAVQRIVAHSAWTIGDRLAVASAVTAPIVP